MIEGICSWVYTKFYCAILIYHDEACTSHSLRQTSFLFLIAYMGGI